MAEGFDFNEEELVELRALFFEQAGEIIESLNELIVKIESNPADAESLRSIRRAVHTLKGDSSAFGFSAITNLAHHYEDALDRVRARETGASRALVNLLLAGADMLALLVKHYRGEGELPDTAQLLTRLSALDDSEAANDRAALNHALLPVTSQDENFAVAPDEFLPTAVAAQAVTPELETEAAQSQESEPQETPDRTAVERRQQARPLTIRVESDRIDAAMNLVGELIIQRSMVANLAAELAEEQRGSETTRRLGEAINLSSRTLSELQESVMRMRLVAIDQVFRRFPRVVRDASIKLGKPFRLEVIGGETEIDKSIVELISDPLLHLVRNACDHGIESAESRRAAGKPEEGLITLRARRVGNRIAIEVADDGSGIDPERIADKAIEKGLVDVQEIAEWTDQQKLALIFLPGFSTAAQVSDMSGRGVGMDVVKTTVDALGGSVTVSSVPEQGSRFVIKLPLTMAIVRAMLFESAGCRFALPIESIKEITRLRADDIKSVNGREAFMVRDQVVPLIRVDEALNLSSEAERAARIFTFVVDLGDGRHVGLGVEALWGEQELVLKTIDNALSQSAVVAGASILGDGCVVLILDPNTLVEQATERAHRPVSSQLLSR